MRELDCEKGWVPKNWCFWPVVLEKTPESPLDCKEIQPVHSDGDQPWVFFGRNDAKIETLILRAPHAKSWLIGKDSDAGRDWGQEEKGTTEDEVAGWHHWLNAHESEWTLGVGDGQGGLVCYDSWGCKESNTSEQLSWTELNWTNPSSISRSGRAPEGGHDNPLQYSCLENPMYRGVWWATLHVVTKSRTQLKWLYTCFKSDSQVFWSLCIFRSRVCPNCSCT